MPGTSDLGRALHRVCFADRQHMLIGVVAMHVVQVAVVQIVNVSIVADRGMSAIRVMLVMVIGVVRFVASGHGFSPSRSDNVCLYRSPALGCVFDSTLHQIENVGVSQRVVDVFCFPPSLD